MVPKFGTKIGPKRADTNRYTPSGCTVRANTQQRHPQPKHDIFHAGHIALQVCVSEPLCCFPVVCRFQFNLSYKIAGLRVMVAVGHPQALVPHTHTQWVYGPCECPTAAPQTQAFVFRFEFIFLQVCVSFLFGTGSPILGPKLVPILGPNLVPGRFVLDSDCVQGWSQFWSQIWDRIWSQNSEPFFH